MDSLIKGNDFAPFPATGHRQRLEEKLERVGLDALLAELAAVDPEAADRSQRNPRRVIRALEVYCETGETITAHNLRTQAVPPRYTPLWLGLDFDPRQELYRRIDDTEILHHPNTQALLEGLDNGDLPQICKNMYNVFEETPLEQFVTIRQIRQTLTDLGALGSMMTGSGSAVFGIFDDPDRANAAHEELKAEYPFCFHVNNRKAIRVR
jgi:hypothetical protein